MRLGGRAVLAVALCVPLVAGLPLEAFAAGHSSSGLLPTDFKPTAGDGGLASFSELSGGTKVLTIYRESGGYILGFTSNYPVIFFYPSKSYPIKKIIRLKSSNRKVATLKTYRDGLIELKPKQEGVTTISYKRGGKKHHMQLRLYWYHQPFKMITFGKKKVRIFKYKKYGLAGTGLAPRVKLKGRLKVTCKSHWKVQKVNVWGEGVKRGTMKIGSRFPKGAEDVLIDFRNSCTKQLVSLRFQDTSLKD